MLRKFLTDQSQINMEIIYTKDPEWLQKWDAYVLSENKASHLMLSEWNNSFRSYGFDYEVAICLENGQICGGFVAVIAKMMWFRFFIIPFGPIVSEGCKNHFEPLILAVQQRAKFHGCCYCHITLPRSKSENIHVYKDLPELASLKTARPGHVFKYVYSSNGLNWVNLKGHDEESKIMTLKPSVRRNIRNSYRKDLVFTHLDSDDQLKMGYGMFEENSKAAGYVIRDWLDMKNTLYKLRDQQSLKMLGAFKEGKLKGAILLVRSGNYFTYILGGSKKEVPDLRTGDFLQWEAIKMSIELQLDGYNISLGGSHGVIEFKNSFGTEQALFEDSKYHWVLKPAIFKMYVFFEKHLKPYKKNISKLLSILKK